MAKKAPSKRDKTLLMMFTHHLADKLDLEFDRKGLEGYVDEFLYRSSLEELEE